MVARRIRLAATDDEAHKLLEETFAYFSKSTYAGPSDLYLRIAAFLGSPMPEAKMNDNIGHGHVFPRPDGVKARCGGPGLCAECSRDLARRDGGGSQATNSAGNPAPESFGETIERLKRFYSVDSIDGIILAQERHIERLQARGYAQSEHAFNRVREG